jgi:hypothetical protein
MLDPEEGRLSFSGVLGRLHPAKSSRREARAPVGVSARDYRRERQIK